MTSTLIAGIHKDFTLYCATNNSTGTPVLPGRQPHSAPAGTVSSYGSQGAFRRGVQVNDLLDMMWVWRQRARTE